MNSALTKRLNDQHHVYAVTWWDRLLGTNLTLNKNNASEALASAESITSRGNGMVSDVQCIHLYPDDRVMVINSDYSERPYEEGHECGPDDAFLDGYPGC